MYILIDELGKVLDISTKIKYGYIFVDDQELKTYFRNPNFVYDISQNKFVNPAKDEKYLLKLFEKKIDEHINKKAQEKGYDNRITCAMRAGFPSPWQAECIRFALWMDSCYLYCYQALNDVKQGKRPAPTIEQLLEELPKFSWEE